MKIKFLGTAAAEGIPGIFCECETCEMARQKKGRFIRTRSQSIIDDKILIDFPSDTYYHVLSHGLDLTKVHTMIITHNHFDHLYPDELNMRSSGYSYLKEKSSLNIYGTDATLDAIRNRCSENILQAMLSVNDLTLNRIEMFTPFEAEGYKITALKATHRAPDSVFYMIEKDGKAILYAHDTNYFDECVWDYFEKNNVYFNLVSLDCTEANIEEMGYVGHMNLNDNLKVKERLSAMKCADEKTIFVSNHFSHSGKDVSYDIFKSIAEEKGFLTSYDGLEVSF